MRFLCFKLARLFYYLALMLARSIPLFIVASLASFIPHERRAGLELSCELQAVNSDAFFVCLTTLQDSLDGEKFVINLGAVGVIDEDYLKRLLPHLNKKISKLNMRASGISFEALIPFKPKLNIEILRSSLYSHAELQRFLTGLEPHQIQEISAVRDIDETSAGILLAFFNPPLRFTKFSFSFSDPAMYRNPVYLELARIADVIYIMDLRNIPADKKSEFLPLMRKVSRIRIASNFFTNIETMKELMVQANPLHLAVQSEDSLSIIDLNSFAGNFNRLKSIRFGFDLTTKLELLPRIVSFLNHLSDQVRKIRLIHLFPGCDDDGEEGDEGNEIKEEKAKQIIAAATRGKDIGRWTIKMEEFHVVFERE
jgi:hypothetical protein